MTYSGRASILRTKSVTKKQTNALQKHKIRTGIEPGTPRRKAITITTDLERILSNAVVVAVHERRCNAEK